MRRIENDQGIGKNESTYVEFFSKLAFLKPVRLVIAGNATKIPVWLFLSMIALVLSALGSCVSNPEEIKCRNPYKEALEDTVLNVDSCLLVDVPNKSFAILEVGTTWKYYVYTYHSNMHDGYTDCYTCVFRIKEKTSSSLKIDYSDGENREGIEVRINRDSLRIISGMSTIPLPSKLNGEAGALAMEDSTYCYTEDYGQYGKRLYKTGIGCVYDIYEDPCSGCSRYEYYCLMEFNGRSVDFTGTVAEYRKKSSLISDSTDKRIARVR